jgi:hypothetical protein
MLSIVVHTSFGSSVGSIHGSSIVVETGVGEFGAATVPDALLGVPAVVVAQPVDESEPEARVKPRSEFDSGTRRRIVTRQPDDDLEKGADGSSGSFSRCARSETTPRTSASTSSTISCGRSGRGGVPASVIDQTELSIRDALRTIG